MQTRRHLLAATAGLLAAPALARAQGTPPWPTRGPIRLIAQFPPGGLVDTITRLLAAPLGTALNQTVVVENRAGAGGVIGTDVVAKAPADGYTLLVSHSAVHVFGAATMPSLPFDPIADFTHLALLAEAPNLLLVRANSPFRTLDDYLAAGRRQPVRYGSSGIGTGSHLLGAMLSAEGRAPQMDHIPYRGSAPAMQDLLANQIESVVDPITTHVQQLRDGALRALAVSAPQRLAAFPDIPTFAELGFPGLTASSWLGLSGPKGLPAPVAERLVTLVPGLLARPELLARLTELQTLPRNPAPTGEAFVALIREQSATWGAVARRFNISVSS